MKGFYTKLAVAMPLALLATCPSLSWAQEVEPTESALTPNQQATADGVLLLCRDQLAGNQNLTDPTAIRLRARCGEIVRNEGENIGALNNALQNVQAEEAEVLSSQATATAGNQQSNIGNRLQALRAGAMGLTIAGVNWHDAGVATGGMASSDSFSRLGGFLNVDYATGDRDSSQNVDAFDFDMSGFTLGGDYRFSDTFIAGVAYHYLDAEADLDNNYGDFETKGHSLSVYATSYMDSFYIEGSITAGEYEYDSTRVVDYHTDSTFHENLTASPDGEQFAWSLGGGYITSKDSMTQSYYLQVNSVSLEIDGYTEATDNPDNGAMAMVVGDQDVDSLTSELGAQFSWAISQDFGVVHPYINLAWVHEFEDGDDPIVTRYANADLPSDQNVTNVSFLTQTDEFDSDYYRVSLGTTMGLTNGLQLFFNYDTLIDLEDTKYHSVTAGIRKEF